MGIEKMPVYFIGIGGIGVSALAKHYLYNGHEITGSDLVSSEITKDLEKRGAKIIIGKQKPENVPKDADLVIYSPAIKKDNPELKTARKLQTANCKLQVLSYPEALGELTKNHFTIAVSGTHGKSTTTAMIGLVLTKAGLDPSVIVGTKVKQFGNSNYRAGKSKYLVIEACEHEESFLHYFPNIAVITNIEADHLDYYKTLKNVIRGFGRFMGNLQKDGVLVANKEDKNTTTARFQRAGLPSPSVGAVAKFQTKNFSIKQPEAKVLRKILKVPGEHNIYNALAALAVARELKIPDKKTFEALSEFIGTWRRFDERKLKIGNWKLKIISDYGHHPTEIKATILAAKEKYPNKRIWCVFQPHQYQRTYYLFNNFVKVFRQNKLNKVIITDIYDVAGREDKKIKKSVNSEKLVKKINKKWVSYLPKDKLPDFIKNNTENLDVLVIMGAGDIYDLNSKFPACNALCSNAGRQIINSK